MNRCLHKDKCKLSTFATVPTIIEENEDNLTDLTDVESDMDVTQDVSTETQEVPYHSQAIGVRQDVTLESFEEDEAETVPAQDDIQPDIVDSPSPSPHHHVSHISPPVVPLRRSRRLVQTITDWKCFQYEDIIK